MTRNSSPPIIAPMVASSAVELPVSIISSWRMKNGVGALVGNVEAKAGRNVGAEQGLWHNTLFSKSQSQSLKTLRKARSLRMIINTKKVETASLTLHNFHFLRDCQAVVHPMETLQEAQRTSCSYLHLGIETYSVIGHLPQLDLSAL